MRLPDWEYLADMRRYVNTPIRASLRALIRERERDRRGRGGERERRVRARRLRVCACRTSSITENYLPTRAKADARANIQTAYPRKYQRALAQQQAELSTAMSNSIFARLDDQIHQPGGLTEPPYLGPAAGRPDPYMLGLMRQQLSAEINSGEIFRQVCMNLCMCPLMHLCLSVDVRVHARVAQDMAILLTKCWTLRVGIHKSIDA